MPSPDPDSPEAKRRRAEVWNRTLFDAQLMNGRYVARLPPGADSTSISSVRFYIERGAADASRLQPLEREDWLALLQAERSMELSRLGLAVDDESDTSSLRGKLWQLADAFDTSDTDSFGSKLLAVLGAARESTG